MKNFFHRNNKKKVSKETKAPDKCEPKKNDKDIVKSKSM